MKVSEIIGIIENIAPLATAASWDACGVQVAAFQEKASGVAVMLDPTLACVEAALAKGANFLLAHHPLSLRPCFPSRADNYLAILSLLLTHKAWLYSAHTTLDTNPAGPAAWLARALDLRDTQVIEPVPGQAGYGYGFVGALEHPLAYTDFCAVLAQHLGKKNWQVCGPVPPAVRRIGCLPGSGSGLIQAAADLGADVYITGDVKYHVALEAGIRVLDVGHFCIEEEMMRHFTALLQKKLSVPVHFFPGADPLCVEFAG